MTSLTPAAAGAALALLERRRPEKGPDVLTWIVLGLVVVAVSWAACRRCLRLPPLPGPRIQLDDGDGGRWGLR